MYIIWWKLFFGGFLTGIIWGLGSKWAMNKLNQCLSFGKFDEVFLKTTKIMRKKPYCRFQFQTSYVCVLFWLLCWWQRLFFLKRFESTMQMQVLCPFCWLTQALSKFNYTNPTEYDMHILKMLFFLLHKLSNTFLACL